MNTTDFYESIKDKITVSMEELNKHITVNYANGLVSKEEKEYLDGKVAGLQQAKNYLSELYQNGFIE
jgi:hypothetical protein